MGTATHPAEATITSGAVERMVSITLSEADYQAIQEHQAGLR